MDGVLDMGFHVISRFREKLFLKGGALLYAHEQFRARPTLDIDFLGDKISSDKEFVKMTFEEICAVSCGKAVNGTSRKG